MRKYSNLFLILAVIFGLIGFTGLNFEGIAVPRVLFLIFTDLFLVSVLAKAFLEEEPGVKYQKVEK